jgi:hypothetical protein
MRRLFIAFALLAATNAFAVAPQFWRVKTADEFLGGEIEGFAVTPRGELRPSPSATKIATFTDPFVLCQTAAANGDRFFGTGNNGKVYRLRGTELKAIYTAPEPEIYAIAFQDGHLVVGTSPNGKVYRVDPDSGKSSVLFDPKQAYIWAIAPLAGGEVAVATGLEGKLYRVSPDGTSKILFDAPEPHLRSIAVRSDGTILAGGSGKGRIYEIAPGGSARALYDSALTEISSIFIDSSGTGWAAGATNVLPTTVPAKPQQGKPASPAPGSTTTPKEDVARKDGDAAATVDVSFSFDSTSSSSNQTTGSAELYRISPDGFVETIRKFDHEIIYSISAGQNGSILLGTGPQGRLYEVHDHEIALVAVVPDKQVVSISRAGGDTVVTTTNSGAVYRLGTGGSSKSELRSAVKDVERFSRFGHYRIQGKSVDHGLAISFRSGNTKTPDATWSGWSDPSPTPEGAVNAPSARYIQWKLDALGTDPSTVVDTVTVAYVNRNSAPVIDSLTVNDPGTIFLGSFSQSSQIVEATNPDEYGIFTSLDAPRDKNETGKRVFRKGYRTVSWRAHDDNGDSLRYSLSFRLKGSDSWLRLRDNMEETLMNFDTSQLPDGTYELRLAVSDSTDNPAMPLSDKREGVEFDVDNTPPAITFNADASDVHVRVTDRRSSVGKVEYSIDAQKWTRLTPDDGLADSPDESYTIKRSALAGHFVIVRAVDAFYNVATASVDVK